MTSTGSRDGGYAPSIMGHVGAREGVRRALRAAFLAAPVMLTAADVLGYVARVEGASMRPALNPDPARVEYVFLSRWAARDGVRRGDVVSLIAPKDPDRKMIKRVIALPGDVVHTIGFRKPVVRVPEGHCWIEGDHTGHTLDSNSFGPVSMGLITAKALFVVWPPERWRRLETRSPDRETPVRFATETGGEPARAPLAKGTRK